MAIPNYDPFRDPPLPPELAVDEAPFTLEELDEALADVEPDPDDPPLVRGWQRIEDDIQAEWALRHVRAAADALELEQVKFDAWLAKIDAWYQTAARPLVSRRDFFEGHLKDYLRRRRELDPKLNSIPLPSGRVASRKEPAKVVVGNQDALLAWIDHALDRDERNTVVRREVKISELRKLVEIQREALGTRYLLELECGHTQAWGIVLDEAEPPHLGDAVECPTCTEATGFPVARVITTMETKEVSRAKVVAAGGEGKARAGKLVPGVEVQPEDRSVWVSLS